MTPSPGGRAARPQVGFREAILSSSASCSLVRRLAAYVLSVKDTNEPLPLPPTLHVFLRPLDALLLKLCLDQLRLAFLPLPAPLHPATLYRTTAFAMVQRVTLRTRKSYNTKSNGKRIVKTPGTSTFLLRALGGRAAYGRDAEGGNA